MYTTIAIGLFIVAMATMIPKLKVSLNVKIAILLIWAAYGIIPISHWTIITGGLSNPLVQVGIQFFLNVNIEI